MESYDILLIIMSVAFIISLVVWSIVGVLVLQVVRKIKIASTTAQQAVENVEAFTSQLKGAGKIASVGTLIKQVFKVVKGRK